MKELSVVDLVDLAVRREVVVQCRVALAEYFSESPLSFKWQLLNAPAGLHGAWSRACDRLSALETELGFWSGGAQAGKIE